MNDLQVGENFAPTAAAIDKLLTELESNGNRYVAILSRGDAQRNAIVGAAYRLYHLMKQHELADSFIRGKLDKAGIVGTRRALIERRLVTYAFRNEKPDQCPEPSRLTRWAGTVAWLYRSNAPVDADIGKLIKEHGGEAECAAKARNAAVEEAKNASGTASEPKKPTPIPLPCQLDDALNGQLVKVRKTEGGGWEIVPRKVLSSDTTPSPSKGADQSPEQPSA